MRKRFAFGATAEIFSEGTPATGVETTEEGAANSPQLTPFAVMEYLIHMNRSTIFYVEPPSLAAPSALPRSSAFFVSPGSSGFVADFAKDCSKS